MITNSFVLGAVLTVPEVCFLWDKSQKSVMMAIYKDTILARQAAIGRIWLVSRASCFKAWGEPKKELPNDDSR